MGIGSWRRSLLFISTGVFVAQVAFSLVIPFLPMFLEELGVEEGTSFWSGVVYSVTFLAAGLMAPVWGALADRHGKRPMIVRAGLGMGMTYALMAVVTNVFQLVGLRIVNGLVSGFIPACTMLVVCTCPEEQLAFSLGMVQAIGAAGAISGPLLGGFLSEAFGFRPTMVVAGAMLAVATLFPVLGVREEVDRCRPATSITSDLRTTLGNRSVVGLFLTLALSQAAILATQPTLPLWIKQMVPERAEVVTGAVFSVVGIATVIGSPIMARVTRFDYRYLLFGSLVVSGLFAAGQALATTPVGLGLWRFGFGLGNAGVTVAGNTLIARNTARESRGRAFGVLSGFISLGSIAGPLVGGAVGQRMGLPSSFYASSVLLLAAALLLRLWWERVAPPAPAAGQETPQATPQQA